MTHFYIYSRRAYGFDVLPWKQAHLATPGPTATYIQVPAMEISGWLIIRLLLKAI